MTYNDFWDQNAIAYVGQRYHMNIHAKEREKERVREIEIDRERDREIDNSIDTLESALTHESYLTYLSIFINE